MLKYFFYHFFIIFHLFLFLKFLNTNRQNSFSQKLKMSRSIYQRRGSKAQNNDKQLLKKLYSQYSATHHQLNKFSSLEHTHKDNIIRDQTFLSSNNQNYTQEQISRAYNFLCNINEDGILNLKSLSGFLEEQGQSIYTGVQMISFLDNEKKGYVSKNQFFTFFEKGTSAGFPQICQNMKKDQQLVKAIDKHYDGLLKNFNDPQFCQYAAKQIKKFKYSQQL